MCKSEGVSVGGGELVCGGTCHYDEASECANVSIEWYRGSLLLNKDDTGGVRRPPF